MAWVFWSAAVVGGLLAANCGYKVWLVNWGLKRRSKRAEDAAKQAEKKAQAAAEQKVKRHAEQGRGAGCGWVKKAEVARQSSAVAAAAEPAMPPLARVASAPGGRASP